MELNNEQKKLVKKYMESVKRQYTDECGEPMYTKLAEDAMLKFPNLTSEEDDENEDFYVLSVDTLDE